MTVTYRILKLACLALLMTLDTVMLPTVNATEVKANSLFVFHPGVNQVDNTYTMSLVVELKSQIASHLVQIVDTSKQTPAQLEELMDEPGSCAVTIGQIALEKVLAARTKKPIFSTLVSRTELDRLFESYARLDSSVSGIYHEQSFKRQLMLSKAIDDSTQNIAVILGRQTRYALPRYQKDAQSLSMNLFFNILKHQASPQQYFSRWSVDNGFLIIINDQEHYSNLDLQSLLVTSNKREIALIGGKKADSETAAIASVYTPYAELIKETAEELKKICTGNKLSKPHFSKHYKVVINQQISEYLGYKNLDSRKLEKIIYQLESNQSEATEL